MSYELRFSFPLPQGLHARPASYLAEIAGRYSVAARLQRGEGSPANAASVIELVAAGVLQGDECLLSVSGEQAAEAFAALREFIEQRLPGCDPPLEAAAPSGQATLPPGLADYAPEHISGQGLSPGIAEGRLLLFAGARLPLELIGASGLDSLIELRSVELALGAVELEIAAQIEAAQQDSEREILRAGLALLRDPALDARLHGLLGEGRSASAAVVEALESYAQELAASPSAYLRERAADLRGAGLLLLAALGVDTPAAAGPRLEGPTILAAESLAPGQLLSLDRSMLAGLILGEAGATSHAAILARSFGIPAIAAPLSALRAHEGRECILDGRRGLVLPQPDAGVRRYYEVSLSALKLRCELAARAAAEPGRSRDGLPIEVAANVGSAEEAVTAFTLGADGIGLFRTEMLLAAGESAPSEDEQYTAYCATLAAMQGRPVIFRTWDIGGDKPLHWLSLPREANPFLGQRGIRIYDSHPALIDTQLRALLRAALHGPLKIMAPMVSTVAEARAFRARAAVLQAELAALGQAPHEPVPVGIMIEVPAAALCADALAREVDFFSIGTNDLCQYVFAADRGNPALAALHNARHPALLRLLKQVCDAARTVGIWVGLCGELGGDGRSLPLLLGLGLDEISMSAPGIGAAKSALRGLSSGQCRELLVQACACGDSVELEELLDLTALAPQQPLLDPALMLLDSTAASKAEALHELCARLYAAGRTAELEELEEAVWAREATYSTGLGYGLAIPHCKSAAAAAASLAVLRTSRPIEWGSVDGQPVSCVLLLAMPAAGDNEHLKVFARLARLLMHEQFRAGLHAAADNAALYEFLNGALADSVPGS